MSHAQSTLFEATDRPSRCPALFGSSPAIQRAKEVVRVAARTTATVLIMRGRGCLGETIARTIHGAGAQPDSPFIRIDCGGADASMLVSKLADKTYRESSATLFLDRVDCLSPADQAKLAKTLSDGRPGVPGCEVRILAGAHDDLRTQVSTGQFRQDLYFCLSVLVIEVPPLHLRRDDIHSLFPHFLSRVAASLGRSVPQVSPRTMELLERYQWPGNVRELHGLVERLLASSKGTVLNPGVLPREIRFPRVQAPGIGTFTLPIDGINFVDLERDLIRQALAHHAGNRTRAARMLGLNRQALLYRMKKHRLR